MPPNGRYIWLNIKQMFTLDGIMARALTDSDAPPAAYEIAAKVKDAIEAVEMRPEQHGA